MRRLPLSVFIIAHNEADRIGITLSSVRDWVDEVIVIDSGSTDDTMKVAESYSARVYFHSWQGYGLQKRFGEEQCRNRWLLSLDADEEVTPELAQEIQSLFESGYPPAAAYVLRIRDLLPGETKLAPLAHTNYVIRLYDKEKSRFSDSPVHDSVLVEPGEATGMLQAPVLHRSFRSLAHAIEKMNGYTNAQALNLQEKGVFLPLFRLCTEFPLAFFKMYIMRGYFIRGRRGFMYAFVYAFGRTMRIAKYMELQNGDLLSRQ
jgi:glycosyltransferase involved in cell wall biosynthesis